MIPRVGFAPLRDADHPVCLELCALSIASDASFVTRWIPLEVNPADAPSRHFDKSSHYGSEAQPVRLSWAAVMLGVWVRTQNLERAGQSTVNVCTVVQDTDKMMACGRDGKCCLVRETLTPLCCLIRTAVGTSPSFMLGDHRAALISGAPMLQRLE